jgi:hypothetical protein
MDTKLLFRQISWLSTRRRRHSAQTSQQSSSPARELLARARRLSCRSPSSASCAKLALRRVWYAPAEPGGRRRGPAAWA